VDTLAAATLGVNENDGAEFGQVVESLGAIRDAGAEVGTTVLAVHHSGKDATKGARGHTVLLGAVDVQIRITGDAVGVKADADKLNAARKPLPEWYKLEGVLLPALPDGTVPDSAVLVPTAVREVGESKAREILELLRDADAAGMSNSQLAGDLDVGRSTINRALKPLKDKGLVSDRGRGNAVRWYITDAGLDTLE
jgi:DNA-binding transcriptional ArsR family regulator